MGIADRLFPPGTISGQGKSDRTGKFWLTKKPIYTTILIEPLT
jgi:hypothetical protein